MVEVSLSAGAIDAPVLDPTQHSHRRFNPLTGEWVVVSPHRTRRPWDGAVADAPEERQRYEPDCYLCPGNKRAGAGENPDYARTFVFSNDFAALHQTTPDASPSLKGFFRHEPARGECRVICFSPDHSLTLADMAEDEVREVVALWSDQVEELEQRYRWVQLFETRGAICGSSNDHPHGQIWASDFLPNEAAKETHSQRTYFLEHGRHLLLDYLGDELEAEDRIVVRNGRWVAVVPYWAYWPYEVLVAPLDHRPSLSDLSSRERHELAGLLQTLLRAYNRVFDTPFPYCSGWHSAGLVDRQHFQLHAHYYPPLLRSADVAKIPASYEVLAESQRDFTPEYAAAHLRELIDG